MDVYTLDRTFAKQDVIDGYSSVIWTERYSGDSEGELVVPMLPSMIQKLIPGFFLGVDGSKEVMIINTVNTDEVAGTLKANCQSLVSWLNNRFIRLSSDHKVQARLYTTRTPVQLIEYIVQQMCIDGVFLNDGISMGVGDATILKIPGLTIASHPTITEAVIEYSVPFKPVYDVIKEIADAHDIGMVITCEGISDIRFLCYKGTDRTSTQTMNPTIRFSEELDSLGEVKEIHSIDAFKTLIYSFITADTGTVYPQAGVANRSSSDYTGFDMRAKMIFVDDLTTEDYDDTPELVSLLNAKAYNELLLDGYVRAVDGKIAPLSKAVYGRDYFMGDIIEVQGNSGAISPAKVTEYIRAQDEAGERAYSTLTPL